MQARRLVQLATRFLLRNALLVSIFGVVLSGIGGYYTFLLYKNLRTNIEELLPTNARSVRDLGSLNKRVSSVENLVVLTFSNDAEASKRFVTDLAGELEKLPSNLIAGVEYRIDREVEFFKKRRLLFIDVQDLKDLKNYVKARVMYEKDKRGLGIGITSEPKYDFAALEKKYGGDSSFFSRFPDGFYVSPDHTKRAMIVSLPGGAADIDTALLMKKTVEDVVAKLKPTSYAPDLEIRYTGNTENLIEEHAALVADLKFTTIVVILLVAGAMLVFYRTFWSPFALVVSVLMGTVWTMGVSYFLTGYLNANSAFLASIVIGNGINFGIIFLARYLEERRMGRAHPRALYISMKTTSKPTLTAALAAGISYGSLMLTDFRGFNQFGVIGLCGMVLCWISAYTLLPTLLTLLDRWPGLVKKGTMAPRPFLAGALAKLVERHPRSIAGISLTLTLVALATFFFHKPEVLELDMNKLRDRNSMQKGSGHYYHYISEIFGKNLSPIVLLTDTRENAQKIAAALRARKDHEGKESLIAWVQTLDDLVPVQQDKKLEVLTEFREILKPSTMKFVPADYKSLANEVLATGDLKPFTENDLSPLVLKRFTEADGTRGRIVLVDKPVVAEGKAEDANVTVSFVRDLREVVDGVSPATAIAGQLPITADMFSAIMKDGPKATLFACAAVFLLVAVLFHNLRMIALVSFTLWIGVFWLAGLILGLNIKINFLNFIALPITFGIGVDYGVNVFQRYREDGMKSILDAVRYTGAAVGLCSLTTVIGYTSLIMASNQAFVSFGVLAVLGEICCVTVATIYLPAYLLTQKTRIPA